LHIEETIMCPRTRPRVLQDPILQAAAFVEANQHSHVTTDNIFMLAPISVSVYPRLIRRPEAEKIVANAEINSEWTIGYELGCHYCGSIHTRLV